MRHRFELDNDFAAAFGQAFPRPQEKWNTLPPPIIDVGLYRYESFSVRWLAKIGTVTGNCGAIYRTIAVLAGDDIAFNDWTKRAQHFDFFVANGGRVQVGWRLHRGQRQQLQHMVLQHVTHCAGIIVKSGAALQPHRFADGNLDMRNGVRIPKRFEQHIGKAQRHQVLYGFLTEIMVDTECAIFRKNRVYRIIDRATAGKIVAQRLFQTDAHIVTR